MQVALKIWRYDSSSGDRALREYEVDAPEWACLLDVLDLIRTSTMERSPTARAAG